MEIFSIGLLFLTGSLFAADMYDAGEARSLLGYDPCITLTKEIDPTVVRSTRKTIFFHGLGGNKDTAFIIKDYYGSEQLAGDIVSFDFVDANNGDMDVSKSSLGQWNDIKTSLYVLKKLHDGGETEIGITGHSRGGATVVNMVAVLADQSGKYAADLATLGIDASLCATLLRMLQKGHIVLECPLIDVRTVIRHQIQRSTTELNNKSWITRLLAVLSSPLTYSSFASSYSSALSVDYSLPLVLQEYRPWNHQAITSADLWNGVRIPTIMHFQEDDEVVGNARNNEFYERLKAANGADCTYFHQGSDGGHNSSFKSFAIARNSFLRKYGASYKPLED